MMKIAILRKIRGIRRAKGRELQTTGPHKQNRVAFRPKGIPCYPGLQLPRQRVSSPASAVLTTDSRKHCSATAEPSTDFAARASRDSTRQRAADFRRLRAATEFSNLGLAGQSCLTQPGAFDETPCGSTRRFFARIPPADE